MLAQNDPEGPPEENGPSKEPPKQATKLVRVLTVMAYLMSVSMAAILLSIYYLCIWKSPVLSDLDMADKQHQQAETQHQQAENMEYQRAYEDINNDSVPYNFTGGSSSTVNETDVQLPPSSLTYPEHDETGELNDFSSTEQTQFNSTLPYNETESESEDPPEEVISSIPTTYESPSLTPTL